jgi:hypothetical protein
VHGKAGGSVEVADLALVPADKSISGTVVDGADEPVAKAQVRVRTGTSEIGKAVTDESGAFMIENLTAGETTLRAVALGSLVSEYVTVEAPASDVKLTVREYDKQTRSPIAAEARTLADKALPSLPEISAEFAGTAEGKPVLICFFDFTLRGSRHAVTTLAARAAELEEGGVAALAVDVSGTAPEGLNNWAVSASIPFRVVGIGENAETRRLEWGVKGLPWLILADKEHVVRAEGFALDELGEKLSQLPGI